FKTRISEVVPKDPDEARKRKAETVASLEDQQPDVKVSKVKTGTKLGRYEIVSRLGVGGMGEVYLASDTLLDRKVALKVLSAKFTENKDWLKRFIREAKAASTLNHPNIITIHEIGQASGVHFIATEYIEGKTLRQQFSTGRMKIGSAVNVAVQIANALVAAHSAGIIHRDIKPENIMLRPDGYVKVLDLGLAKMNGDGSKQISSSLSLVNTAPGVVMGTVNYMSPEQARGLPVDMRSDIFSLGVVLYEMLVGRPPFDGETASDILVSILD